jgi:glycosyltransferase involved in cell wall biosynthesis
MPEPQTLPPIADQPVSVILLAHNDEAHLEKVLDAWLGQFVSLGKQCEILVVDDHSADATVAKAEALCARRPLARALRVSQGSGIGAALRTGIAQAQFPLVFYTTADHQYQLADLPALFKEIDKVHLISGYRRWQPVPLLPRAFGWFFRLVARLLVDLQTPPLAGWLGWEEHLRRFLVRAVFGVRSLDVNCYYVLCRRDIFSRLPIQSDGPFAQAEILAKANFLGHLIAEEVPVAHQPRGDDSRAKNWFADFTRVRSEPDFSEVTLAPVKPSEPVKPPEPAAIHENPE